MKFTKEGMEKGMEELAKALENSALTEKEKEIMDTTGVQGRTIGVANVEKEKLPQKRIVDVEPRLDVRALTNVSYCFPLYALANNILMDEFYTIGVQNVGIHWAAAVVIAYDLWLAAAGEITIFGSAPKGYWELRSAISPTIDRGYKYRFIVQDFFVGANGMYPAGFPLQSENVSLAWVTNNATALYTLANVIPVLSDEDIENAAGAATDLWTAIAVSGGVDEEYWKMTPCLENTIYTNSSAAFAANSPIQATNDPMKNYCVFRHENQLKPSEVWLAKLGLCSDDTSIPIPGRLGFWAMSDFVSVSNLMTRIIQGRCGKTSKNVIRPKYVLLEDILNSVLSAVVEGDLQKNSVIGEIGINMAAFDSIIKNIEEPAFLYGFIIGIMRKFQTRNLMGFDNSEGGMYPCTGSVWTTVGGSVIDIGLNFVNEMAASMAPLLQGFTGWLMERNAVLVTTGKFSINVYNGVNPPTPGNLVSLINVLQPDTNPVAYAFLPTNILALPTFVDPLNFGFSQVRGTAIPTAQEIFGGALAALQGNVLIANVVGNSHTDRTLLYYTRVLSVPEQFDQQWSKYYVATLRSILNVYEMQADHVMYDFTKPLCVTFAQQNDYCSLYHEYNSVEVEGGELNALRELTTYSAKMNAHPIAGTGYEGAINEIAIVTQHQGGGFLTSILDSVLPGVGNILGKILPI